MTLAVVGVTGVAVAVAGLALVWAVPRVPAPEPADLTLRRVTIVEPDIDRRERQTVAIYGGRITAVAPSGFDEPSGPFDGLFVMPGLIDLHVHLPPPALPAELRAALLLFLVHGVTSVRDAGTPWGWSLGTRERVARGAIAGPRVFSCGPLLVGAPSWPGAIVMGREEDVPEVVERLRERGVDCVKVLDTVAPAIAARIRAEAHAAGLRVIGHAPNGSDRLLLDEAQHLTGLGSALRTRHPTALAKAVADSLAERTAHTPTLVVLERFAQVSEGERPCSKGCRSLPRYFQSVLWDPRRIPAVDLMVRDLGFAPRERFEAAKEVVAALARGGVPILAGTDSPTFYNVPGESLHEEIALLHEAGLPAEDALAAATTRAAEALGEARLGRIEPGAPADFVLLRADPVQSVENRTWLDIAAVVVDGRLYRIDELETSLREYERFFEESAYSWLIEVAVRAAFSRPAGGARP